MAKAKLVKRLTDKGFPSHSKYYEKAHGEASTEEKKKFPKGYEELKKKMKSLGKHEVMATNKKSGKIEIESKFKKYKKELAFHEEEESKNIKRLKSKK